LKGIAASPGIAMGKAYIFKPQRAFVISRSITDVEHEKERLQKAVTEAKKQIEGIYDHALKNMGAEEAKIFEAHIFLVDDPVLFKEAQKNIEGQHVNAEWALKEASDKFIKMFEALDNEYIAQRAADIKDITGRILNILMEIKPSDISDLKDMAILIAEDLLPSDTARMDKRNVLGIVTELGASQSHTAIIARNLGIPAVVGLKSVLAHVSDQSFVLLDGSTGEVIINPDKQQIDIYNIRKQEYQNFKDKLIQFKNKPSITRDGAKVHIMANIGTPKDIDSVLENDAEGIGLFRTEFLYMDRNNLPSEQEQFDAYKEVVSRMQGKPVVIRTLDIGGDKDLPYLGLAKEDNPYLGYRAIRYCLDREDIFRIQLKAILRASAYGCVKIMFPMISTITELRKAKAVLNEERETLKRNQINFDQNIEVGIMVEIPSCAVVADLFAKEADFFSIGTNDLTQYTLAVDRGNPRVSKLYSHYNPALLRMIKHVIESAHKNRIWCGMCGEAASDALLIPLLLGMGLTEFSMSPPFVLRARSIINNTVKQIMTEKVDAALFMATGDEIEEYLKNL